MAFCFFASSTTDGGKLLAQQISDVRLKGTGNQRQLAGIGTRINMLRWLVQDSSEVGLLIMHFRTWTLVICGTAYCARPFIACHVLRQHTWAGTLESMVSTTSGKPYMSVVFTHRWFVSGFCTLVLKEKVSDEWLQMISPWSDRNIT